jgi:hypothetical protein
MCRKRITSLSDILNACRPQVTTLPVRFEFDKDIDVTDVRKTMGQHRTIERELTYAIVPAEIGYGFFRD